MSGIAVNAAIVGERPTGLGVYGLQLIRALDDLGERMTVVTSCPEAVDAPHALWSPVKPLAVRFTSCVE